MFKLFAVIVALGQMNALPVEYVHQETFEHLDQCEEAGRVSAPKLEAHFLEKYAARRDQDYKMKFECRAVLKDA